MKKLAGIELETERPYRVLLKGPDGFAPLSFKDGTQAWVEVVSLDSMKARLARAESSRRASNKDLPQVGEGTVSAELMQGYCTLAALTTGWNLCNLSGDPLADEDGSPFAYSKENAEFLYTRSGACWIAEQVGVGAAARQNFTPAPKTP